jgi:hypothetical protein
MLADRDRFIGAWRLVSLEEPGADGASQKADATGQFVFSRDGHASVQVMYRNVGTAAGAPPIQYAQSGYEATFGRYEVDEQTKTFTLHVEGAHRGLVQKTCHASRIAGNQLIVKPSSRMNTGE